MEILKITEQVTLYLALASMILFINCVRSGKNPRKYALTIVSLAVLASLVYAVDYSINQEEVQLLINACLFAFITLLYLAVYVAWAWTYRNRWIEIVRILTDRKWTITTMESCTGGSLAGIITNVPGASKVLHESFVTYCNEAKTKLGVPQETIDVYSVYSKETAIEMAKAGKLQAESDIGIGITGQLGRVDPKNPGDGKLNLVWYAIVMPDDEVVTGETRVPSYRHRNKQKEHVIREVALKLLEQIK